MSDADLRELERLWEAAPRDQALIERLIVGFRRAGRSVPADVLDARVLPARTFESREQLHVEVVNPDGAQRLVGETPGKPLRLPRHRAFIVASPLTDRAPMDTWIGHRVCYSDPAFRLERDPPVEPVEKVLPPLLDGDCSRGSRGSKSSVSSAATARRTVGSKRSPRARA